jgi:hypothetical protein
MRQHAQAFREQQVCYLCVLHRHPSMCPHPHRYCTRVGVCACVFASFLAELLTRKCAAHCAQAAWSWRSGQENRGASTPWFTLSPSLVRHMLQTGMQLPHCHCILLPAVDTCACRGRRRRHGPEWITLCWCVHASCVYAVCSHDLSGVPQRGES